MPNGMYGGVRGEIKSPLLDLFGKKSDTHRLSSLKNVQKAGTDIEG